LNSNWLKQNTLGLSDGDELELAVGVSTNENSAGLVAKGTGQQAEEIVFIARYLGIPVVVNKPLTKRLYGLPCGAKLPLVLVRALLIVLESARQHFLVKTKRCNAI